MTKDAIGRLRMRLRSLIIPAAAAVLTLVSCVSHEGVPEDMVTLYPMIGNNVEIFTRSTAFSVTNSSSTYNDSIPVGTTIVAYAVPNSSSEPVFQGRFENRANGWFSTLSVKSNYRYFLYAHAPAVWPGATNFTFNRDNAHITFSSLNVLTTDDPWVSISAARPDVSGGTPTLTWHSYDIGSIEQVTDASQIRKVWMAMDHLFAKATVSFCVDSAYNSIRTIRLREASLSTASGAYQGAWTYSYANGLSVSGGSAQAQTISINLMEDNVSDTVKNILGRIQEGETPAVELTTDTLQFAWFCFLPDENKLPQNIMLSVKYDVYNKAGTLIREEQTATNRIPLDRTHPEAGHNYQVVIRVNPSYIYVLSDSDADEDIELKNNLE